MKHVLALGAVLSLGLVACDDAPVPPPPVPAPTPAPAEFTPVPAVVDVKLPLDAAPSPDGSEIFYTALGSDDETHSLWKVAFAGGDAVELATGFNAPLGIAVSRNNEVVYVGDAGDERIDDSDLGDATLGTGALFTVPFAGGAATRIASVDGFSIRALDVIDDGGDVAYFTGKDAADGAPALMRLAVEADELTVVSKGAPLSDPSGVAVAGAIAYVVDTSGAEDGRAAVMKIEDGAASVLASGIRAGLPAGIAFNSDGSALFVSSLDIDGKAQVTVVDVATGATSTVQQGLEGNDEAGGLHRAHDVDAFAWAGSSTVYAITFQ